jgi:hypothetical protein
MKFADGADVVEHMLEDPMAESEVEARVREGIAVISAPMSVPSSGTPSSTTYRRAASQPAAQLVLGSDVQDVFADDEIRTLVEIVQ